MLRSLLALIFIAAAFGTQSQTPVFPEFHKPSSFDNSDHGTLSHGGASRSSEQGRYGFLALFEIRVAPGVVKVLDVRQFFDTEQSAVQGFMRVQAAMPNQAVLANLVWINPTEGHMDIGQ